MSCTVKIFLLLLVWVASGHTLENTEFEPIEGICEVCSCTVRNESNSQYLSYSILDCSAKNFQHMLASWPDIFDNDLSKQEIVFSLSGNDIKSLQQLPPTEADLVFSCRHCNLTELASGAFLDTPNINRLDLSWNLLTGDVLRPDVFRGKYAEQEYESIALDELDLSYNSIGFLDASLFEHMVHLRRLSLAHNPLKELTDGSVTALGSISRLEHLDLSYAQLVDLPREMFEKVEGLRELLVQGNQFTVVPSSIRLQKPTLMALYIGENPIQRLDDESFSDLDHLTQLNISGMPLLDDIDTGTFAELKSLEVLSCSHNPKLDKFDMSDLKGLIRLRQVSLAGRVISAHKRQLKVVPASRRKVSKRFAFQGESAILPIEVDRMALEDDIDTPAVAHNRKRRRDEDYSSTDDSSDFYGFAADSFIFSGEEVLPTIRGIRRSTRIDVRRENVLKRTNRIMCITSSL